MKLKEAVIVLVCCLALPTLTAALEKKPITEVKIDQMTQETQAFNSDQGVHLVWWIPSEYWEASFARDGSMSAEQTDYLMSILRPYVMLAIVQADVSPVGAFNFYPREQVAKSLDITLAQPDGKTINIEPIENLPEDLRLLQQQIKPVLAAAMGNMGQNFYFFTLEDSAGDKRLISPYEPATLTVQLKLQNGESLQPFIFETPLNSLYISRVCPNGKEAHVSWKVCPWDGSELPD